MCSTAAVYTPAVLDKTFIVLARSSKAFWGGGMKVRNSPGTYVDSLEEKGKNTHKYVTRLAEDMVGCDWLTPEESIELVLWLWFTIK
jgi:hypothetical protein